jgi:putative intracellular protease/amidase
VAPRSSFRVAGNTHRLAFAMLRDQSPYDATKWAASVAAGMTAMAKAKKARQNDVTCPPPATSLAQGGEAYKDNVEIAVGTSARG